MVYDNFRPGILERLRIDYETLKQINPRIIACSVSGYGHTGPGKDRPAFDLVVQALGGIMSYTGPLGGEPVRMGAPIGDMAGGIFAAHGVLAALYQREHTGQGSRVDVALLDSQIALAHLPCGLLLHRRGNSCAGRVWARLSRADWGL